jgi:hypothetical protein
LHPLRSLRTEHRTRLAVELRLREHALDGHSAPRSEAELGRGERRRERCAAACTAADARDDARDRRRLRQRA